MAFLASLMRQGAARYVLKGGMAMRALYASARLTKDIDFDCEDSVSPRSMASQIPKALLVAARETALMRPDIDQTKRGARASRWRLVGSLAEGAQVTWEVEISVRGIPDDKYIETTTIQPPAEYRTTRFVTRAYGPAAMAAGKVNALLSDARSVPRDVYDLFELGVRGASPVNLWTEVVPRETLSRKKALVLDKIGVIDFDHANAELLPYLARDVRQDLDEKRWDDIRIRVAESVGQWFDLALPYAKSSEEFRCDPDTDFDLAGR